jgi:Cu(I)/Ag(I) efflux system membrane fusion protein
MHPQIQQTGPGDCPICGMDLIPLENDASADEGPRTMSMSESSRALAKIQTTLVQQAYPEAEIRLVGQLDYDETLEKALTARFPARIDELFVNYNGISVAKGDHLAKVYSPELLSVQRELLIAYRVDPASSISHAAREKLRLWDLLPEQIDDIIQSGEVKDHFVLKAPIGGIVVTKNVKEGDYVKTGETLFKIVDLSHLWLYLDAYESDLPWLRYGQLVTFSVEAMPGERFHGQIAFIGPEVSRQTRTVPIRVNVPNLNGLLKPGMFVRAVVASRLAEVDKAPLLVPTSAVLRTGKRAVVYVENPDAERPTYEGREIVLGPRAGETFIVTSGLELGERVVTKGAFKIDSALQIKAKPSMMNPAGGGPTPGHDHVGDAADPHAGHAMTPAIEISADLAVSLMQPYLAMQAALAADDLDAAKAQAQAMVAITGHAGALPELFQSMLEADSLDALRKPHFETLSNALIATVKARPKAFESDLFIMNCPMVYGDRGADWLQNSDQLRNPYFGAMMLQCGEVKEALK